MKMMSISKPGQLQITETGIVHEGFEFIDEPPGPVNFTQTLKELMINRWAFDQINSNIIAIGATQTMLLRSYGREGDDE